MNEMQGQRFEDEIHILDYLHALWKRKVLIILPAAVAVFATAAYSLSMKDVYQATAVISPISDKGGGEGISTLVQQFGGMVGISLPNSASSSEIINLLKSNVLREKVVEKYKLLPVLFPEDWDEGKNAWKREDRGNLTMNLSSAVMKASEAFGANARAPRPGAESRGGPTMWDAIRKLDGIVAVKNNPPSGTITISVDSQDPETAAAMVNYFLATLVDHMSEESRRVARANERYLEKLLMTTADPIIRQKIYNLIAQQIEVSMMAEMKENFAFKIIDPTRTPDVRIRPKRKQMVVLSLIISLFAGIFLALFAEHVKRHRRA